MLWKLPSKSSASEVKKMCGRCNNNCFFGIGIGRMNQLPGMCGCNRSSCGNCGRSSCGSNSCDSCDSCDSRDVYDACDSCNNRNTCC